MLKVIKKNGNIVDFAPEKIKLSLSNSADDIKYNINQKELGIIAKEVENRIISMRGEDGLTSNFEIRSVIIRELKDMGYGKIADSYYKCRKSD